MALKKPSDLFETKRNLVEDYSLIKAFQDDNVDIDIPYSSENFVRFKSKFNTKTLEKVDEICESINILKEELGTKLTQDDLDNAMYSYLVVLDENFKVIEDYVKHTNKKDLVEFRKSVAKLTGIVNNILEDEMPKYKKIVTKTDFNIKNNFDKFQENVGEKLTGYENSLDEKLIGYEKTLLDLVDQIKHLDGEVQEHVVGYTEHVNLKLQKYDDYCNNLDKISSEFLNIKTNYVITEERSKALDKYLKTYKHLDDLKQEVLDEISKLSSNKELNERITYLENKIESIREIYGSLDAEKVSKEIISESILAEPSNTENSDSLTPLDKNFVTVDQLQEHYRLFLNRIQQQLSTLGGGGETRLKYLDDIVGIATNASAYNGQYLSYDHSLGKFVFSTPAADYSVDNWVDGPEGVYTQSRVGVGITTPQVQLDVVGTTQIIGQVNITGNMNVSGIVTATDFDSLSDVNLKTNVVVIENPLDKVLQLRGVNFDWKEDNRPSMGVIAQEVEEILPQLVHGHETKTVNYNGLIGLLIECVKKQQEEIDELKKRLP